MTKITPDIVKGLITQEGLLYVSKSISDAIGSCVVSDANARGIKDGDIVKLYNDRGATLGIAQVTERVRPGVVHSYESLGKYDPLEPGKPGSIDRAGCVNLLTPARMISKNAPGMANNSCLIEISKWEV